MAYASTAATTFHRGNVVHEGPAFPLGKEGGFAGTHILVPRGGIAVHINGVQFSSLGLLESLLRRSGQACLVSRSRRSH